MGSAAKTAESGRDSERKTAVDASGEKWGAARPIDCTISSEGIDVCERLTEFDESVLGCRRRRILLTERMIGVRTGTGGSPGSLYLRKTRDKRFFPEQWEARSILAAE